MPNFLILGAAKSGTTALWFSLRQHPDIFMGPRKEPNFFCGDEILTYCNGPGDFKYDVLSLEDYQALYAGATHEKARGEASNSNLYFSSSCARIRQYVPEAKLIALLRHPADRAFSAYMHLRRDGRETVEDFGEALALEAEREALYWARMWHLTKVGRYYEQLKPFFDTFDHAQIRVYLYDDFSADPLAVLQDIFRFLEVDPTFEPTIKTGINRTGVPKYPRVNALVGKVLDRPNPIRFVSRRLFPEVTRHRVSQYLRGRNLIRPRIPPDIRRHLTAEFEEEILHLQDLIGRDLSGWLKT